MAPLALLTVVATIYWLIVLVTPKLHNRDHVLMGIAMLVALIVFAGISLFK